MQVIVLSRANFTIRTPSTVLKIYFPGFVLRAPKWKKILLAVQLRHGLGQDLLLIDEDEF